MILYQKKANPFSVRLLGALFNPIILIFFVIPIVVLVYFALHGDISTSPVKGMWFGACFLLFLSTVAYYNIVKSVRTQLTHAELSSEGLKIQRVNYDEIIETFIPIKEIQLDLKKHQNKNATRSGEWHTYSLQFFDGKSIEPVLVLREKLEKLQEILTKIEQENLIPLQAAEKDFLLLARRPEKFSFLKTYRKASLIGGLIFFLFAIYKVAPIVRTLSFVEESSLAGSWKVIIPLESAGMLITINGDSTASESVFNTPIKWKYKEGDGISNQPAVLTFSTENPGG